MRRSAIYLALIVGLASSASAQTTGTTVDHEALRKLKADVVMAVNAKNYEAANAVLARPFMATVVTQESFTDFDKLRAYFENLYIRPILRMKSIQLDAEADELSTIMEGAFAVTRGSTRERYELTDGRVFDMAGRWTAISIKQAGQWKLMAVHTGTDFLDNPVINAIQRSVMWVGVTGACLGAVGGLVIGLLLGRRRAAKAV